MYLEAFPGIHYERDARVYFYTVVIKGCPGVHSHSEEGSHVARLENADSRNARAVRQRCYLLNVGP